MDTEQLRELNRINNHTDIAVSHPKLTTTLTLCLRSEKTTRMPRGPDNRRETTSSPFFGLYTFAVT